MPGHRTLSALIIQASMIFCAQTLKADPTVFVAPANVSVGEIFTAPVSVANASDLFAFQFDLAFDPSVLTVLKIVEGGFLPSGGATVFVRGTIDNTAGTATANAGALTGGISGVSGGGQLANLVFQAITPGTSSLSLSNVLLLDSALNNIPFSTADGTVLVVIVPEPGGLSWIGLTVLSGALLARCGRRRALGGCFQKTPVAGASR